MWDTQTSSGGLCVPRNTCSGETPLADRDGTCLSCGGTQIIDLDTEVGYRCESACSGKRLWKNGRCISCPADGTLHSLGWGLLSQAECGKCDNLQWVNGACSPKT